MWLRCVGGPLDGKAFLPGDDVPEGGVVTLTVPAQTVWHQPRRGYYERVGDRLVWRKS